MNTSGLSRRWRDQTSHAADAGEREVVRRRAIVKVMVLGIRGIPGVQGGVETHAEHLYQRLAVLRCDVEALVRTTFVPRGRRLFGRIVLRRLWAPRTQGAETLVHSIIGVLYAAFVRPDILHIHAIGPAIVTPIARLFGLNVVVTHHGPDYEREKWGWFARWVLRTGERFGMKYSHARIAISAGIADRVRAQYGCDSDLIPNGVVETQPSAAVDHVRRYHLEPGRYFLQVSRMVPEKRQLDLIEAYAAARHTGWRLALVGALDAGNYSQQVKAAAQSAGVILTGFLAGEPLRQLYSHAGGFVLPSSHEGLPIVLLEALSHGLPVLTSDIPANLELGLDSSSYFPLGDTAALAEKLVRLARSPPQAAASISRRQWVVKRYDWDRIAQQTLEVYMRVVGQAHTPAG